MLKSVPNLVRILAEDFQSIRVKLLAILAYIYFQYHTGIVLIPRF